MSLIGIVSDHDNYSFIKNEIKKDNYGNNIQLININNESIQNMKNIRFETIVILEELKNKNDFIENILNSSKNLIINTDNNSSNIKIKNTTIQIITYGMNQKATVTASSIKEENILICLQRNIQNIQGKTIEIQENCRKLKENSYNKIYDLLIIYTLEQLYK